MKIRHFAAVVALLIAAACGAWAYDEMTFAVSNISAPPRQSSSVGSRAVSIWDGRSTEKPGEDVSTGAITVGNAAQLAWLAQQSAAKEFRNARQIQITSDIDLGGHQWTPIPDGFITGIVMIDGGGHIIRGLKIHGTQTDHVGLFGTINGSVSDLHLIDVDIDVTVTDGPTVNSIGALAGELSGALGSDIKNCSVQGSISVRNSNGTGDNSVGALVGKVGLNAQTPGFTGCAADVTIRSEASGVESAAGGIIGTSNASIRFDQCVSAGSVYSNSATAGGILGRAADQSSFTNCVNRASVVLVSRLAAGNTNVAFGAGGILGAARSRNGNISGIEIDGCVNYGTIKLEGTAGASSADLFGGSGGLVGIIFDSDDTRVTKSMNAGNVSDSASAGTMGIGSHLIKAAGGLVGTIRRATTDDLAPITIQNFRNTAAISSTRGFPTGGLIGTIEDDKSQLTSDKVIAELTCFYNIGDIASSGGPAGGIIGSIGASVPGSSKTQVKLDTGYSTAVPTGSEVGGAIGLTIETAEVIFDPSGKKFAHPAGAYLIGSSSAGSTRDASCQKDLSLPGSFQDQSGAFWDGFDGDGLLPPAIKKSEFTQISGITLTNARSLRNADGSVSLQVSALPDAAVRNTTQKTTFSISEYMDPHQSSGAVNTTPPIASGLEIDSSGRLTVPADKASSLKEGTIITIEAENHLNVEKIERLSLMYDTAPSVHEVREVAVRGTPLTPEDSTTKQLYIEWTDVNGAVHSTDRPLDMPSVTWSIIPPADPNWQVDIAPETGDPFRASLKIGAPQNSGTAFQEYTVRVALSYGTASDDIVYTRKFFAGSFPTKVTVSPEDTEMIDAANSVLARTKVSILPGNFQPVIPDHLLRMLERRLAEGLQNYVTDHAVRAADDLRIEVLSDMDMIRSMMVERPVEESLPICFRATDKHSANIELDLSERPELEGRIVLLPMTYSVTFRAEEMADLFGADAAEIMASPTSQSSLDRIFDVLVLHKRIKEGSMEGWYTRLVSGVTTPAEALGYGMMQVEAIDSELTVRLAYNVINFAGESFVISGPYTEGGNDTIGYIILPDGLRNEKLIDPLWSNVWSRSQNGGSGSGGGGCATSTAAAALAALIASRRKRG